MEYFVTAFPIGEFEGELPQDFESRSAAQEFIDFEWSGFGIIELK